MDQQDKIDRLLKAMPDKSAEDRENHYNDCPEPEILSVYITGRLPFDEEEAVEKHLVQCSRCRRTIIAVAETDEGMTQECFADTDNKKLPDELHRSTVLETKLKRFEEKLGIIPNRSNHPELPCVMVVDDDPDYLSSLTDTLMQHYAIISCSNGDEALSRMDDGIKTVILDIKMPGMDGFELARKLKNSSHEFSLIFNTGYSDEYPKNKIKSEFEASEYVTKDNSRLLMNLVRNSVSKPQHASI